MFKARSSNKKMCHSRNGHKSYRFYLFFQEAQPTPKSRLLFIFFFLRFVDGKMFIWINFCKSGSQLIKKSTSLSYAKNFCYRSHSFFRIVSLPGIQSLPIDLEHHSGLVQHHVAELINFNTNFFLEDEILLFYQHSTSLCSIFFLSIWLHSNYFPFLALCEK